MGKARLRWLAGGILVCSATLAIVAGCKRGGEEEGEQKPGSAPPPVVAAADLVPVFGTLGPVGVVPERLVIELARSIAENGAGEADADGSRLQITPAIDGELRRTGPSTLAFLPAEPFAPATTYEVALLAVRTSDGKTLAAPRTGWRHRFVTPPFQLAHFGLAGVDFNASWADVDLTFSAAVDLDSVEDRVAVSLIDSADRDVPLRIGRREQPQPHVVRLRLHGVALRAQRALRLNLLAGARAASGSAVAPHAQGRVWLPAGELMEVEAMFPAEGASGWYVEVVCDDAAVAEKRYYWDRVTERGFGRLSARCQLAEEELAEHLEISPPVRWSLAPSGGGFRLFGDFGRGPYAVRLAAGARTLDGGVLRADYQTTFSVPARSPQVAFVAKGRYLPRSAWRALPLRHLNVDQVTVAVRQVPERNLVFWMSDENGEGTDERTSDLIVERTVPLQGPADEMATSYLDVGSWVPANTRGLLELTVSTGGARDSARLLLTDLQLVAKRTGVYDADDAGNEVQVWAFDSRTLAPARGVDIQLLKKSGTAVATCQTGAAGGCRLEVPAERLDPSLPFALLATSGSDLTYLKFDELEAEVEETRVAGEPYAGERKYRAAIYGDRGVYRPGETAHLVAIVRDAQHVAPPAAMPVQLELLDPRGKVVRQHTLPVNAAGVVTLDTSFAAFAATGRYEARLQVGGEQVGSHAFRVEEFVPERMRVEAKATAPRLLLGDEVRVAVGARYLFGGIPAGAPVELQCELATAAFTPRQNANFTYGVWRDEEADPEKPTPLGAASSALDDEGNVTLSCPAVPTAGTFRGPAQVVARAAVFEAGSGRTTVGEARVPVHPERFYLGLSSSAVKVERGEDLVVQGVVVDWDGKLLPEAREVELELLRLDEEYGWYYDEDLGHETWRRYLRPVLEDRSKVQATGGRFTGKWRPQADATAFLVRARGGNARSELRLAGEGGWYWWGDGESEAERTPRPDRATWLDLELPERTGVGERVEVKLDAPFRGRVLLTAETDEVVASEWKDIEPGEVRWTFRLPRFVPNVYVTAFAVKDPRAAPEGGLLPDRAFGVASLAVEPREFTQAVTLTVPGEVRSGSRLPVDLDLGELDGDTWATVAVVDEGILSLTRFESPDPARQIFSRRGLGVQTFETVGWTLAVPPPGPAGTGGDGGGELARVQPVKPVALWSGLVQVPASGKLRLHFDLPAYRGQLRVMAVTAGPRKLGRAEAKVTVRDPLVLQVTLPRFLALGDDLRVPVAVTNLSGARREITVRLAAEDLAVPGLTRRCPQDPCPPLVEVVGSPTRTLTLADGASGTAVFSARARGGLGGAAMVASAQAGELRSQERGELPVLPAGPRVRRVQRLELAAGNTAVTPLLPGWLPLTERSTVWVTSNPYGEAFGHLEHLLRYPYGCVEQTTSTTRPLLFLPHLIGALDAELAAPGAIEKMAMAGIERVLSMQTPAGGFGYWPGDDEPARWGTAYATHMLLDAQKLRYRVPQGRLDDALAWMENQISHHYERGGRDHDGYAKNAEPYMHYVLALAGRARKARVLRLIDSMPETPRYEDREQLYMLKAALYLAGDHRYERDLRQPDVSALSGYRETGWSFYSDLRMRGFMLATFGDLFGRDPAGEPLAALVAESLKGESARFTTQELVWGITGLGKRVEAGAKDFAPPVLTADGRTLQPVALPPGVASNDRTWEVTRASEYANLQLQVPRKGEGKLWLILVSEGVRSDGAAAYGGEGLRLERRWLDVEGNPLAGSGAAPSIAGVTLGDLFYVELTLRNTSGARLSNIALVDRLPAGWEIENPRLGRSEATPEWVDDDALWEADHLDLRDDRIEVFGHLENGQQRKVVYAVRAVTAGSFQLPPAEAEAMYDPRHWSRVSGGTAVVEGPWGEE